MKRFAIFAAVAALVLLLAACGGATTATLTVDGNDSFQFNPATASVPAGAQVTLSLTNTGVLEHSWTLVSNDADVTTATDADAINGATTGPVAAGASAEISFTAPAAGAYRYVCTVPGHAAGGMVGALTVTP